MKKLIAFVLGLFIALPSMAGNVPNGYTELEYIQSSGTQWIDTGVLWKSGYKIQLDLTSISSSGNYAFFGASNGASYNNGEVAVWWNKGKFDRVIPTSNSTSVASQFGTYANNTRYLVTYDKSATTGNSDSITNEGFYDTYVGTNNIFLFGTHRTAGDVGNAPFKLHSAKMWDENNSLVRNFIPAKDSRGTVGMYDTVEGRFYENKGSGTFTAGRELDGCRNLFDSSVFNTNVGSTITYKTYSIPNGKYTMSTNFPRVGYATNVFVFEGEVTSGAATDTNGVFDTAPRTITVTDGKYTIAYRSTEGSNTHNPKDYNWQLESGDTATNYVPYSAACHPTSCKNLFNPANVFNGYIQSSVGLNAITRNENSRTAYVAIQPNTKYTISKSNSNRLRVGLSHTVEGTFNAYTLFSDNETLGKMTYTAENTDYEYLLVTVSSDGVVPADLQVEEGSTATAYTPYSASCGTCTGNLATYDSATGTVVQNGTPTPTNPIYPIFYTQGKITLRRVGDVADSYDASTGKITRRVGVVTFNGTEDWKYNYVGFWSIPSSEINSSGGKIYCTHFESVDSLPATDLRDNTCWAVGQNISLGLHYGEYGDIDRFKQWLTQQAANGTPVTVYYPLATPTEETVGKTWCETAIKIATTKYNNAAFSGVVTALSNAVDTIKTVVANTITQATAVANLHSGKQTKPTDTCPNGKICLLVEDEQGTPHWYEIIERAPGIVPAGSGYTQVEYLQSDGNQYIDTGFKFTNPNVLIESKVDFAVSPGNSEQDIISTYSPDLDTGMAVGYSGVWFQYSKGDTNVTYSTNPVGTHVISAEYNFASNTKRFSLDGGDRSGGYANTIVSDKTAKLFSNGNGNGYFLVGKMYYLKIHENGSLVRDFVPARRNSDGVLGMYDTVSGNFFTNAGSGKFYAPDQWVPNTYTRLEYIESTGTQYIDTGARITADFKVLLDLYIPDSIVSSNVLIRGVSMANSFKIVGYSSSLLASLVNNDNINGGIGYTPATRGVIGLSTHGTKGMNSETWNTLERSYNGTDTLRLFDNTGYRLYGVKIYDGDTPVREMVPVKRNSDNEVGLYDCVNGVFYDNDGSGEFLAPNSSRLPSGYTELQYINKPDDAYVDTGIKFKSENVRIELVASYASMASGMFGAQDAANTNSALLIYSNHLYAGKEGFTGAEVLSGNRTPITIVANNGNITLTPASGTAVNYTYIGSIQSKNGWHIGGMLSNKTIYAGSVGTIGTVKIWDNDSLVLNAIPAQHGDEVGFYDTVQERFLPADSATKFTAGPVAQ